MLVCRNAIMLLVGIASDSGGTLYHSFFKFELGTENIAKIMIDIHNCTYLNIISIRMSSHLISPL